MGTMMRLPVQEEIIRGVLGVDSKLRESQCLWVKVCLSRGSSTRTHKDFLYCMFLFYFSFWCGALPAPLLQWLAMWTRACVSQYICAALPAVRMKMTAYH